MFDRRGQAAARLGAALLLAMTCASAPAVVLTAQAAGAPTPPGECTDVAPSASATSTELGGTVEVTGDCFPRRETGTIEIFIQGDTGSQESKDVATEGGQSVYASFTPESAGEYQAVIEVAGATASTTFTVEEPEETPAPPTEEPSDPPTEEPSDPPPEEPEEPSEPPVEEPSDPSTDPGDGGDEAPPGDGEDDSGAGDDAGTGDDAESGDGSDADSGDGSGEEPGDGAGNDDGTGDGSVAGGTGDGDTGGDEGSSGNDQQSDDGSSSSDPSPKKPFPSSGDVDEERDSPAPSAAERPGASSQSPESSAPKDPGTATDDVPVPTPEHTAEQQEAAALAVLMTSLFAHGVSEGEVGISPAEADAGESGEDGASGADDSSDGGASDGGASDGGGEELAETGTEVSAPAALAGVALLSGAGLLWQRRRD